MDQIIETSSGSTIRVVDTNRVEVRGSFTLTEEQAKRVGVVILPTREATSGPLELASKKEPPVVRYQVTMNCPPKSPRRNGPCKCGSGKKYKKCCGVKCD